MPESIVKYLAKLEFEIDGIVDKADIIGAIFGQTEGLFGPEMNLNELQKNWKVGRIEISIQPHNGKGKGNVTIPMSTDISTVSLIAAAVEAIDKVGPCSSHFKLKSIDDVRALKREAIVARAKGIMKDWSAKSASEGEDILRDVSDVGKKVKITAYGKEELPAGPAINTSKDIIIVEGRADVLNLLRAGIENTIAVEGTNVPDAIAKLSKEKQLSAFLDGDRGGDLILRELNQVIKLTKVSRAPKGREVEELTPIEILEILNNGKLKTVEETKSDIKDKQIPDGIPSKLIEIGKQIKQDLEGTLESHVYDSSFKEIDKVPVSELVKTIESKNKIEFIIFDGIITSRLIEIAEKKGVKVIIGNRMGKIGNNPSIKMLTFQQLE
ncbi:MAG: DNA primase [Thaumarchaeota archaeon]|nr:DNA primase [Nitrososphaerota archaeon]